MAKRLFVGNLPFTVDESKLSEIFSAAGKVVSAKVITDKFTNQSRGFGFVEMSSDSEADAAIAKLNGHKVEEREIAVNEAKPLEERPQRDFHGGHGSYGGGRNSGGYGRGRGGRGR